MSPHPDVDDPAGHCSCGLPFVPRDDGYVLCAGCDSNVGLMCHPSQISTRDLEE